MQGIAERADDCQPQPPFGHCGQQYVAFVMLWPLIWCPDRSARPASHLSHPCAVLLTCSARPPFANAPAFDECVPCVLREALFPSAQRLHRPTQFTQITRDCRINFTRLLAQLAASAVLGLGIHCLNPTAISCDHLPIEQVHVAAQRHELLAHLSANASLARAALFSATKSSRCSGSNNVC